VGRRELRLDLFEERCASLKPGVIHVVVGEIVAPRARGADPAHGAGQEATRRTAHHERQEAPAAIGAHDAETLDVVKAWRIGAIFAKVKLTPSRKTLATNPLRRAGNPMFQTGNENTIASAARIRNPMVRGG
jgi:hypothetical protein